MGLKNLADVAHAGETILSMLRANEIQPDATLVDSLLQAVDSISGMLDDAENSNECDISKVMARLEKVINKTHLEEASAQEVGTAASKATSLPGSEIPQTVPSPSPERGNISSPVSLGDATAESTTTRTQDLSETAELADLQAAMADRGKSDTGETVILEKRKDDSSRKDTVRIKLDLLNELMQLAGELVLVRNQQLLSVDKSDPQARTNLQRLNIVTSELQETIMATRMQPIGNLFGKFTRIVRDLGKKLGKQIEIEITGSEVELDNTILEALSDPLTHLVRNCCDHGIESPPDRARSGKPEVGRMVLRAYHESGQINIEITDDGKGIDPKFIRRKILEKGLKTEAELSAMGDKEITALILLPGFSTAEKLSDVSGRGVGMDVVKTSIEGLGGTLDIDSQVGRGTTIYMRLPLTLAIIPCLVVMVGEYRYAIPQVNLEELVCLYDEDVKNKIECAGGREVYRQRNQLLPMVRLEEVFKRDKRFSERVNAEIAEFHRHGQERRYLEYLNRKSEPGNEDLRFTQSLNFAVLKVGLNSFGLIVDRVIGTEEIVVKPMHPSLKSLGSYAGATVMGDGKVALIVDAMGIARHAGISLDGRAGAAAKLAAQVFTDTQTVLLFASGPEEQFAMALPLIKRIESIPVSRIEKIGGKEYITIDDVSTLVLRLDKHLNVSACEDKEEMYLILPKHCKNPFGILASRLVDTQTTSIDLNTESYKEEGLLGTAIIKDKMTLFLDIHSLIERAEPTWFPSRRAPGSGGSNRRILLVEDSPFFRQLAKKHLESEGYRVTTAENGQEGLTKINEHEFDLVVSDIQMPIMDGLAFLKNLRDGERQKSIPAIALTSLDSTADRARASEAGFNRYELKMNRDGLLTSVSELLGASETDN